MSIDYLLGAGNAVVDDNSDPLAVEKELDSEHAHISVIFNTQILQQNLQIFDPQLLRQRPTSRLARKIIYSLSCVPRSRCSTEANIGGRCGLSRSPVAKRHADRGSSGWLCC